MNRKDIQIISFLRKNARMPLTSMSRKTGIPVSTIFDRLKANEHDLIIKHTCLIDFSKIGYNIKANILIKAERESKKELKEYLQKSSCINSIYKIDNGYDFMIEVLFRQLKDMDDFLEILDNKFRIEDKKSFFIIEDIKKEEFMSRPVLF